MRLRVWAVLLRHLYLYPHSMTRIMEIFYWPTLNILLWGFLTVFLAKHPSAMPHWTAFLLGAVIFWDVLYRSQHAVAISFLEELWSRNLLNLFASPLSPMEFLLSTMILALFKFLGGAIVAVLLAWAIYGFNIFLLGVWLVPMVFNLIAMGWSIGVVTTALIMRFGEKVTVLAWGLTILIQPFAAVFYPVSVLPEFLHPVSYSLPCTYVFEGMRSVIATGTAEPRLLVFAFLLNLLYMLASLAFFLAMYRQAQERGLLVKLGE